jgi:hypothetical protein
MWGMVMKLRFTLAAFLFGVASLLPDIKSTASAMSPFAFVESQNGRAWWAGELSFRPMGFTVAGLTLSQLNQSRQERFDDWCFVQEFSAASFISRVREIQSDIEVSLSGGNSLFQIYGTFTDEAILRASVGVFESCEGRQGNFLAVVDPTQNSSIVYIEEFSGEPAFLWLRNIENEIALSSCFECGHTALLHFDRGRRTFYWENIGD